MGLFDKLKGQSKQPQTPPPESTGAQSTLVPSIGRMPFPAYRGKEPYIFISYAHLDADMVFREIKGFNEQGYHVWYDEGISPGNEWTGEIAHALENCALFVVFITPNSVDSFNVLNEINFALSDRKPFIAIHLAETVIEGGLKLQISTIQAILKYKMTEEEYVYKYTTAFTRLGLHQHVKPNPYTAPSPSPQQPQTAPVPEASAAGDFVVDHGLLREYLGQEKNVVFPDEVQLVGSHALGKGSAFVETVDLNKAGAILNGAFTDCPLLKELKVPESVTMIGAKPFVNCPNLILYCRQAQLPEGFVSNFGGKEIVYLDSSAPQVAAAPVVLPSDTVVFSSPEMHDIVCAELGVPPKTALTKVQCAGVTSLHVCGNAVGRKFNAYINDGKVIRIVPIVGDGGQMATVSRGSLDCLADIPLLRNLTKMILPYQCIYDLTPLATSKIEKLDLSANILDDLSPLASMRFLTELILNYTQLGSLSPLTRAPSLSRLTFQGISQSQFDELCETENETLTSLFIASSSKLQNIDNIEKLTCLESLYIGDSHITDITPALSLKFLRRLGIRGLQIPDFSVVKEFKALTALTADKGQEALIAELYGGAFPFKAY